MTRRLVVIGLDCVPPELAFDRYRASMPNLGRVMAAGTWGPLRSTVPPITIPAWVSMATGRDPGELGLYGFRRRVAESYDFAVATSHDLRHRRVWDYLGEAGKRVAALFVPLTWPPSPVRGHMVSCLLTPSLSSPWAFPSSLERELTSRFGPYRIDVEGFRDADRETLVDAIHGMTAQHFDIALHVWVSARPDFLMMVEMGPDRLHHALWRSVESVDLGRGEDPLGEEGRRYYEAVDRRIGQLLEHIDGDTGVMIVSDHGARSLRGGLRINAWLEREGWLVLRRPVQARTALAPELIDFSRTRAWATGGYCARIFLNVAGREPRGIVPPSEREAARDRLAADLRAMAGPDGASLNNHVVVPEDAFREVRGAAPDLMLFAGDLDWRAAGTVGGDDGIFAPTTEQGLDGCNHDWDGIFAFSGPGVPGLGQVRGASILDVAPTILGFMGTPRPPELRGRDWSRA